MALSQKFPIQQFDFLWEHPSPEQLHCLELAQRKTDLEIDPHAMAFIIWYWPYSLLAQQLMEWALNPPDVLPDSILQAYWSKSSELLLDHLIRREYVNTPALQKFFELIDILKLLPMSSQLQLEVFKQYGTTQ